MDTRNIFTTTPTLWQQVQQFQQQLREQPQQPQQQFSQVPSGWPFAQQTSNMTLQNMDQCYHHQQQQQLTFQSQQQPMLEQFYVQQQQQHQQHQQQLQIYQQTMSLYTLNNSGLPVTQQAPPPPPPHHVQSYIHQPLVMLRPTPLMMPHNPKIHRYMTPLEPKYVEPEQCAASSSEMNHTLPLIRSAITSGIFSRLLVSDPSLWLSVYDGLHHATLLQFTQMGRNITDLPADASGNVEPELIRLAQTLCVTHHYCEYDHDMVVVCTFTIGLGSAPVRFYADRVSSGHTDWDITHPQLDMPRGQFHDPEMRVSFLSALGVKQATWEHVTIYLSRLGEMLRVGGGPFD